MFERISFEETKSGLKYLAKFLNSSNHASVYDESEFISMYHGCISHLTKEYCLKQFPKLALAKKFFPSPREFAEFFGTAENSEVTENQAQCVLSEIRRARSNERLAKNLSAEARYVLAFDGKIITDLNIPELFDKFTIKIVRTALVERAKGVEVKAIEAPYVPRTLEKMHSNSRADLSRKFAEMVDDIERKLDGNKKTTG